MPPNVSHTDTASKLLPALHHALSGSTGTLISTCALYPLSLVITRLQVQRQLRVEGKLAPPAPPAPDNPGQQEPNPGLEHDHHSQHSPPSPDRQGPTRPPQQQQQPQEYLGIADAFSRIWKSDGDGGLRAFYTGLAQDAPKSVLDSFLFFLFYEWFRSMRLSARTRRVGDGAKGRGLAVLEELAVGMVAGACSRAFTTPIANVVTRKQTASLVDADTSPDELSVRDIVNDIRKQKGIAGFWSGYSASLVLTLNPSITFFLQEFLKKGVVTDEKWDDPGPRITFLLAAVSKAIASSITYPFQIAKTRLQVGVPIDKKPQSEQQQADSDEETDERDIDKEVEEKLKATRAIQKLARQSIFGTITQIVKTEGVGSLYDGIQGELLKGFFSHGTTMLAKGVVHKLFFKLYLFTAALLAELRSRRARSGGTRSRPSQHLPVALQYRLDRSQIVKGRGSSAFDYGINVVANMIDGTQRAFDDNK